jgi:ferric-dicitrate binding protein FerR (iron transport regulator)
VENEPIIVVNDELIARYLAGEAEPPEAMAIHDWRELSDENRTYFDRMQEAWQAAVPSRSWQEPDLVHEWQQLESLLDAPAPSEAEEDALAELPAKPVSNIGWLMKLAAGLVLIAGVGLLAYRLFTKSQPVDLASVHIKADHTLKRELPDQSKITLSPQSSITYTKAFAGDTRDVKLTGEAYFQVTPDKQKPFVIQVGKAQVRVVGTSFNIDEKGKAVVVSVTSGKVQFSAADTSVFLVKGQTGIWAKDSRTIVVNNSIDENTIGYATGQLAFHNTPLGEVLASFEKTYSCTIKLKNTNLATCPISTKIPADYSIQEALSVLEAFYECKVVEGEKNTYQLEGGQCPAN